MFKHQKPLFTSYIAYELIAPDYITINLSVSKSIVAENTSKTSKNEVT